MATLDKFYCEDFFPCNSDNFAPLQQSFPNLQSFYYRIQFEEKHLKNIVIYCLSFIWFLNNVFCYSYSVRIDWRKKFDLTDELAIGLRGQKHIRFMMSWKWAIIWLGATSDSPHFQGHHSNCQRIPFASQINQHAMKFKTNYMGGIITYSCGDNICAMIGE